jgi:DNA-binding MarR family transcriptional regulator
MPNDHTPIDPAQLDELRQQYIGRLLLQAQRASRVRATEKLRTRGHDGLSIAHTNLISSLDLDGTRITTLAERIGISKQAVGHLVLDLEQRGYIERAVDPADRRATIVTFTDAGWRFLNDAYYVKREIEAEYSAILGEQGMVQLRTLLNKLIESDDHREQNEEAIL